MILKLNQYHFLETNIKAAKNKPKEDEVDCELMASGELYENPDDASQFQLVLTVSFKRKAKKPPVPYSGSIKVAGHFSVDPSVPKERMEMLLMVNGLSMLYSSAREHVLSVTSRGPWPPLFIPTVSFNPNADSIEGKPRKK